MPERRDEREKEYFAELESARKLISEHELSEALNKEAKQKLVESVSLLNSFFNSPGAMRGVVEVERDNIRHIADNSVTAEFFGRTQESMSNMLASEMGVDQQFIDVWIKRYEESKHKKQQVNFEYEHKADKQSHFFSVTVNYLGESARGFSRYTYVLFDITEHKRSQKELQKAHDELDRRVEQRTAELSQLNEQLKEEIKERKQAEKTVQLGKREWESTFDAMSDWVSLIDIKYRILRSNRAGEKFVDLPTEETIGQTCCEVLHGTQEPLPGCPMQKMLQTHQRESVDLYVKEMNQWLRIVVDPVMDKDGNLVRAVHIVRDITELKKIEEERLKVMKLESIGIIAGGIAHDFNNLLSIIIGNIELVKDDIKPEIGAFERLNGAGNATLQAKELTKQLITFSRGGAPVKEVGSIGEFVMDTINLSTLDSNIKCNFFIPHDLWLVGFDEGQMKHAINNVIVNAAESMPDGGTIDVTAENFIVAAERGLPLPDGKYVKVSIQDRGVGIPEEHLSRIFDPYFTTKEMGVQKGMGLGLATTYSIINRHDGHIIVESDVGGGTTFILYLPEHEKDIRELKPDKPPRPEKPEIRTGRILVMDDEEMVGNITNQMLSRFGYDVEVAKDGAEAIELYKIAMDSGKPFEVVILDLTVKVGMGGKDAVKNLSAINPQAKAIVSSGYFNDPVMTDFRRYGFIGALPKPYTMKDLKEALDKVTKE